MIKKIIKIFNIIFIPFKIALILFITYTSFNYLNEVFVNEEADYGMYFHSIPDDSLDVIVLGSSQAEFSFDPALFYEDTGLYSYVMSSACQPLEVSYQMLREGLKYHSPKLVVLEMFTVTPSSSVCEADSVYVIPQYFMNDDEKYNTLNYLDEEKRMTYYNEFINLHNNWRNFDSIEDFKPNEARIENFDKIATNFGYKYNKQVEYSNIWFAEFHPATTTSDLQQIDYESLTNIINLCKENNIELLLYKTPVDGFTPEDHAKLDAVKRIANENSVPYIDYFEKDEEVDFWMNIHSDSYHAYQTGANIITSDLSKYILQNYTFNHKQNIDLDVLYDMGKTVSTLNILRDEIDPDKYINRLYNFNDYMIISYKPTNLINQENLDRLNKVGLNNTLDRNKNYFAILKDNVLIDYNYDFTELNADNLNVTYIDNVLKINENYYEPKGNLTISLVDNTLKQYAYRDLNAKVFHEYGYNNYYKK